MVQLIRHLETPRTEFTVCFGGHCNKIPPGAPTTAPTTVKISQWVSPETERSRNSGTEVGHRCGEKDEAATCVWYPKKG